MKAYRRYKIKLAAALLVAFGGLAAVIATGVSPNLGLDLRGGISVILTASSEEGQVDREVLDKTVEIIRRRIDALGVAEPEVSVAGSNVSIQLPGVEDEERALDVIGSTAQLTFRQGLERIEGKDVESAQVTKQRGSVVNDEEVVYESSEEPGVYYRLAPARLTGEVVTKAEAVPSQDLGGWEVILNMNDEGAETWASLTGDLACIRDRNPTDPDNPQLENPRAQVAVVLDGKVETITGMKEPGGGTGVECGTGIEGGQSSITGMTQREAKDLALVLQTGALPITLDRSEVNKVSPTLGEDSLQAGLRAGILGLALVMLYVLLYYRALGLIVWLGLAVFTATMYTIISILGETAGLSLTLAGIAGIIVSIGVTADSYIVAFERLKDEAHSGKTMRAAVDRGMARAFRTILVADFVTGAAAIILFYLAVGAVKGFALTLGLATVVDVLVAYFFTRSAVVLLARSKRFSESRFIGMKEALGVGGT